MVFFVFLLLLSFSFGDSVVYVVDTSKGGSTSFSHRWEACVGSGHAALSNRADWRLALKQVQSDLGFKRVRFHGIFDDDMSAVRSCFFIFLPSHFVLQVLRTGTSFFNIDASFDYIFSIGMAPYVELSFTPTLFKTTNATLMNYRANISPPLLANWTSLIAEFAAHLEDRYGAQVVRSLFFEVWNEYNCGFLDSPTPRETYYDLYAATALALR